MFEIHFTRGAEGDLRGLPALERGAVVEALERSLSGDPDLPAPDRRLLSSLRPPWTIAPPVRELRVGGFRVFYDVDGYGGRVFVRAVGRKAPRRTREVGA